MNFKIQLDAIAKVLDDLETDVEYAHDVIIDKIDNSDEDTDTSDLAAQEEDHSSALESINAIRDSLDDLRTFLGVEG